MLLQQDSNISEKGQEEVSAIALRICCLPGLSGPDVVKLLNQALNTLFLVTVTVVSHPLMLLASVHTAEDTYRQWRGTALNGKEKFS